MIDKMIERLPDAYNKNEGSNIYKMVKLAADQLQDGEDTLQLIHDWRDVDQAQGAALDKLGKDVGEPRQGLDDEAYRKRVKIKIRANLSGGEIETLNGICIVLLGERFDGIQEGWALSNDHPIGPKPAMMLFTLKADGVNYGIPMALIDDISGGGIAANWELIIGHDVDITQVDFTRHPLQPYQMTNERNAGDQQPTFFAITGIEAATQYIAGLHNPRYCGTTNAGEGGLIL